jgi:hypothetical protein
VPAEAERILDGVVSEMRELTRDFETFVAGVSDDVLRERLERLAPGNPVAKDLRELSRIMAEHGLVDLRPSLVKMRQSAGKTVGAGFQSACIIKKGCQVLCACAR